MTVRSVEADPIACLVPGSATERHRAVVIVGTARPRVVVTVIRGEHHSIMVAEAITSVTRVPGHYQGVVGCLAEYSEPTVLSIIPGAISITSLQIESHLVAAVHSQLMKLFVAKPVVASRVVKSDFVLLPRTIEGVRPVYMLLDQQWNAVSCKINIY